MLGRRAVALLMGVCMFHLMLVGSDLVCSSHTAEHAHSASTANAPGVHHGEAHHQEATDLPCDVPSRPDCCQALTSCSSTLSVGESVATALTRAHDVAVVRGVSAPISRVDAPDPPPPKA